MMRCLKRKPFGCGSGLGGGCRTLAGLLLVSATPHLVAQDDYLQALESESSKITPESESAAGAPAAGATVATGKAQAGSGVTREQFESLLQDKYRGTYVFYRQLQPQIQEEIFSEFESGVPIAELRDKVVDRYLQR